MATSVANFAKDLFFLRLVQAGKLVVDIQLGMVYNPHTGRYLGYYDETGAKKISWRNPAAATGLWRMRINRLVWLVAHGPLTDPHAVVVHRDGNKKNNAVSNLLLLSPATSCQRAIQMGLNKVRGVHNARAMFSVTNVLQLRREFAARQITVAQIAACFGCHPHTVRLMLTGKTYADIPGAVSVHKFRLGRYQAQQLLAQLVELAEFPTTTLSVATLTAHLKQQGIVVSKSSIRRFLLQRGLLSHGSTIGTSSIVD